MHTKTSGINKVKKFFQHNHKLLTLFTILTFLNIFFLCLNFQTNNLTFGKTFIFIIIGSILLEILLCAIILIAKKKKWKIEKLFLILSLIIGVFYVFAIPIGRAPDEAAHFFRIYEITTGHFTSDVTEDGKYGGSTQASNIDFVNNFATDNVKYIDILNNLSIYPDNSEQIFIKTSASSYHPIDYFPHLLGMGLGEFLHLPILVSAYIAKLFNLIICILILYFSIKYIPFLKEFIFFIAFLHITMQGMSSLSADGFIIAIAIAFISFILYSTYTMQHHFAKKHYLLIFSLCLVLSLSKIVYAFLCLLIFAIPKKRFNGQKQKTITILIIGGICAASLLVWLFISASIQAPVDPTNREVLLSNPLKYLAILIRSVSSNFYLYLNGTLGGYLEWFNVVLSPLYIIPSLIIFILLCKKARDHILITPTIKILAICIFIIISTLIFSIMFTQWTKPGETIIDGVQGRYFIPLLLLIPLALMKNQQHDRLSFPKFSNKNTTIAKTIPMLNQNYYIYGFYIFEGVYAIIALACTHL